MKIAITYELESANGSKVTHGVIAKSLEEAEEICQKIEKVGYKLLDVTREE